MNATLSQQESLSALLDAECDELELRRLLPQLTQDDELRKQWQQLNRLRAASHSETAAWAACDVSDRVRQAIADQPQEAAGWQHRLWRPLAGMAVAATVAAVVVTGAGFLGGTDQPDALMAAQQREIPAVSGGSPVIAPTVQGLHTVSTEGHSTATQPSAGLKTGQFDRFEPYWQRHADQAALGSGMTAWSPAVRVVAAESKR